MTIALDRLVSSLTIETTQPNEIIIVDITTNGAAVTAVSSPTLGSFTLQGAGSHGTNFLSRWFAIASAVLVAENMTITATGNSVESVITSAWQGVNLSTPFQVPEVLTLGTAIDPLSISPTGAGVVLATYRTNSVGSPTVGSGFTGLAPANSFFLTEFLAVSAAGTVSATMTTGAGNANGGVLDVLNPVGGGGNFVPFNPWPQIGPLIAQ